ncbi:MAG: CopG family transcriptional regulator [Betaproteobacteria bacterium]
MRTIIDLTDRQISQLDRLAKSRAVSRAELVRRAVDRYLEADAPRRDSAFGLWKRAGFKGDGLRLQRRMRREWKR